MSIFNFNIRCFSQFLIKINRSFLSHFTSSMLFFVYPSVYYAYFIHFLFILYFLSRYSFLYFLSYLINFYSTIYYIFFANILHKSILKIFLSKLIKSFHPLSVAFVPKNHKQFFHISYNENEMHILTEYFLCYGKREVSYNPKKGTASHSAKQLP